MTSRLVKHQRIVTLTNAAMTGKYTWKDIKEMVRNMKLSEPTVTIYMKEIKERLAKAGIKV